MKKRIAMIVLALLVGMLPACMSPGQSGQTGAIKPTVTAAGTQTAAVSASPSAEASSRTIEAVSASPSGTPKANDDPLSALPDPALWKASLQLKPEEYPKVDGSTATLPLAVFARAKITGEPLEQCGDATRFTTTGPSYLALAEKAADLLIVYEAPEEIKDSLKKSHAKLKMQPIGLDALVFLTNQGNPVDSLTHQQLIDIYTGKLKNWNEVGGENTKIIPYQRVSNSGSQALMLKLVMKKTKIMDAPTILKPAEMGELIDQLAQYDNTRNALGYSVYYYVRNMYSVPGIKLLAVNGVQPSTQTIASGQYPYVNEFYAVIREDEPNGSPAHRLFDWLTGAEGARAVTDSGYVASKQ